MSGIIVLLWRMPENEGRHVTTSLRVTWLALAGGIVSWFISALCPFCVDYFVNSALV